MSRSTPPVFRQTEEAYIGRRKQGKEWKSRVLSNFVLRVLEQVETSDGSVTSVEVFIRKELRGKRSLTNEDLLNHTALERALKIGDAAWYGTAEQLQLLRNHLGKQPCSKYKGTTVLGRHTVQELDQEKIGEGAAEVVDVVKDFDYIVLPTMTLGSQSLAEPPIKYVDGRDNEMAKAIQRMASGHRQISRR